MPSRSTSPHAWPRDEVLLARRRARRAADLAPIPLRRGGVHEQGRAAGRLRRAGRPRPRRWPDRSDVSARAAAAAGELRSAIARGSDSRSGHHPAGDEALGRLAGHPQLEPLRLADGIEDGEIGSRRGRAPVSAWLAAIVIVSPAGVVTSPASVFACEIELPGEGVATQRGAAIVPSGWSSTE